MSDTDALLESIGVNLKRRGTVPVASPSTDTDALLKSIGVNLKQPVAQPAPTPVDTDALLKSIGVKRQSDATFDSDTMLSMDNLARQIRATPLAPPEPPAPCSTTPSDVGSARAHEPRKRREARHLADVAPPPRPGSGTQCSRPGFTPK